MVQSKFTEYAPSGIVAQKWDAIVVGSGAAGSVAAKVLTEQGLIVLLLEAGPDCDPQRDLRPGSSYAEVALQRHNSIKNQLIQEQHPGYWENNPDLFVDDLENPYLTAPGKQFRWIRGKQVGGRMLTWGGACLRFSDYEFKAASIDGIGYDWPIDHAELSRYYDHIEKTLRVCGGLENLPQQPDGCFARPVELTAAEQNFRDRIHERWPERRVIHARGTTEQNGPLDAQWPARTVQASFLKLASQSGRLTLRPNSIVKNLLFKEETGEVEGLAFVDRLTLEVHNALARSVILCASTIETIKILSVSTSSAHPKGVGNSAGHLGRGLMDHFAIYRSAHFPSIRSNVPVTPNGVRGICIPRFRNIGSDRRDYSRGFGIWSQIDRYVHPPGYPPGDQSAVGFLYALGEMLPNEANCVKFDPTKVDRFGMPLPIVDISWGENEIRMAADMRICLDEMIKVGGGRSLELSSFPDEPPLGPFIRNFIDGDDMSTPGLLVHEMGGARMGLDRTTSVLNEFNQCWDAKNVFVLDMASFPSGGWQNPTLTLMAIAARGAEYAAKGLKSGNL